MSLNSPKVSVLMPVYNAGPYLREAIESILQQTYADFEFLIINDGSTDDTLSVLAQFTDPRIKLINQSNKGLIDSLNEGIHLCKGDIIARMDGDDVCLPNRLEVQVDFLKNNPEYVMVGGEADIMDKNGNYLLKLTPTAHTHEEISQRINQKNPFIHPAVTFYKQAVIKAGLYPKNALTFEDHLLWKKMLGIGKLCNLKDNLLKVRFNPESVTIDEKWRGPDFVEMRKRSIINGFVSDEDGIKLKELVRSQNFHHYKQASYFSMIGKKYLWDQPNGVKARENLRKAILHYPKNVNSYILYLFSFLPGPIRQKIYQSFKKHG